VALVRTEVSEDLSNSFIRVTKVGELGTMLAVTSNRLMLQRNTKLLVTASLVPSSPILVILLKEALSSSETSFLTTAIRHKIPEDTILHSHCHENIKSYAWFMILCTGSEMVLKRLISCTVPTQPSNLRMSEVGETSVTLQWSRPAHAGENIVSYELYWNDTYAKVLLPASLILRLQTSDIRPRIKWRAVSG
jgi:hypothetical protein